MRRANGKGRDGARCSYRPICGASHSCHHFAGDASFRKLTRPADGMADHIVARVLCWRGATPMFCHPTRRRTESHVGDGRCCLVSHFPSNRDNSWSLLTTNMDLVKRYALRAIVQVGCRVVQICPPRRPIPIISLHNHAASISSEGILLPTFPLPRHARTCAVPHSTALGSNPRGLHAAQVEHEHRALACETHTHHVTCHATFVQLH